MIAKQNKKHPKTKTDSSVSLPEARKLVLLSQGIPSPKPLRRGAELTLSAIEKLGYVQIDTITVIQRAHHHTLWNRNVHYQPTQLDQLVEDRHVFEYWAHAAAFLPMRDYRFSLPRKQAIACGKQEHWFERDQKLEREVLKRIKDEGPLMARDFAGERTGVWQSKPAKRTLENLFMQGDLMTTRRANFQKVYDLTERVIPPDTNTSLPSTEEHARHLIERYLLANGLGQASEISYLRPESRKGVAKISEDMVSSGELIRVRVADTDYLALPRSMELLKKPLARSKLKILSPFDNLVIQRQRLRTLFDFDYQIECYVPAAKRRFGYFSLPILWNGRLAARMDCKAERRNSRLVIHHLALEPWLDKPDEFIAALKKELINFLKFNQCDNYSVTLTTPKKLKQAFEKQ